MKTITIAIAGLGSRGRHCYGHYVLERPDKCKVVAAADISGEKRDEAAAAFGIPKDRLYTGVEELLKEERLADILIIATPDDNHFDTAIKALKKGYHLLLEKPIATTKEGCMEIARVAKECDRQVVVCHVLRYSPFYAQMKQIIEAGEIGEIVSLNAVENVGYWHQAHSYVRGNWRDTAVSSPMILAKSSHDMDIILWLMDKKVKSISSYGGLHYFKPEKAPDGAAKRCLDGCKAKAECPYDAEKIYITNPGIGCEHGYTDWPVSVLAHTVTPESIREALETGPYGRCVFHCDNDAVDHQVVNLLMEDGTTAHLTMAAFSAEVYRTMQIMGTLGMIEADMRTGVVKLNVFGREEQIFETASDGEYGGHGGGDSRMFEALFDYITDENVSTKALTAIENSIDSHLACFAAERSRQNGGVPEIL